jgi:hypothetical protein
MKFELTQELVKRIFEYDPLTGVVVWRKATSSKNLIGNVAGAKTKAGYLRVRIYGKDVFLHHVIWVYMTGKIPEREIGHVDGNKTNNVWSNLREGRYNYHQHLPNRINKKIYNTNKSGYTGVFWNKRKQKWQATIMFNQKHIYLGIYGDIMKAVAAREKAEKKYFGPVISQIATP